MCTFLVNTVLTFTLKVQAVSRIFAFTSLVFPLVLSS